MRLQFYWAVVFIYNNTFWALYCPWLYVSSADFFPVYSAFCKKITTRVCSVTVCATAFSTVGSFKYNRFRDVLLVHLESSHKKFNDKIIHGVHLISCCLYLHAYIKTVKGEKTWENSVSTRAARFHLELNTKTKFKQRMDSSLHVIRSFSEHIKYLNLNEHWAKTVPMHCDGLCRYKHGITYNILSYAGIFCSPPVSQCPDWLSSGCQVYNATPVQLNIFFSSRIMEATASIRSNDIQ